MNIAKIGTGVKIVVNIMHQDFSKTYGGIFSQLTRLYTWLCMVFVR